MQQFIKYTKEPSNKADFFGIFQDLATFRLTSPTENQRKTFFQQQYQNKIMNLFYTHLELNKLLPGTTQDQIGQRIARRDFQHVDIIDQFFNWLSKEDTHFVCLDKALKEPSKPNNSYNYQPNYPNSNNTANNKHIQPIAKPQIKKQGHFILEKVPTANPAIQVTYQNRNGYPTPPPTPPAHPKTNPQNYISYVEPLPLPPPPDDKPIRVQFLQKLADCFEYPQRWNSIKEDINGIMQRSKKAV